MYLRKGLLQLVISSSTPVSASSTPAVQTTANAMYLLIAQDKSSISASSSSAMLSHDHCHFKSFTGRESLLRMCSSEPRAINVATSGDKDSSVSSNPLSFPPHSSTAIPAVRRSESGRNNNGSCYFRQTSVQRHGHGAHQLYHQGLSIRNLSSYSGAATTTTTGGEHLVRINIPHKIRMLMTNRQFSSAPTSKSGGGADDGDGGDGSGGDKTDKSALVVTLKDGLDTRESASDFLRQLTEHQKQLIYHTLNIEILREKYEDRIGGPSIQDSHFILSKFGRPATAKEDPTGTLCEVSDKWLHDRLDEKAPPAPASAIWAVAVKNALPFIGFGFLDNLIMILAGDYIDITIGTALGISTMAAAALGNTISDVAGIGSAWYVEGLASKIGIRDPDLSPKQFASGAVRWACNLGRAFGVTIGCLLGMFPLLFLPNAAEVKEKGGKKGDDKEKKEGGADDKSKFA